MLFTAVFFSISCFFLYFSYITLVFSLFYQISVCLHLPRYVTLLYVIIFYLFIFCVFCTNCFSLVTSFRLHCEFAPYWVFSPFCFFLKTNSFVLVAIKKAERQRPLRFIISRAPALSSAAKSKPVSHDRWVPRLRVRAPFFLQCREVCNPPPDKSSLLINLSDYKRLHQIAQRRVPVNRRVKRACPLCHLLHHTVPTGGAQKPHRHCKTLRHRPRCQGILRHSLHQPA